MDCGYSNAKSPHEAQKLTTSRTMTKPVEANTD